MFEHYLVTKKLHENLQSNNNDAKTVIAGLIVLGLGALAAFDAYQTTHKLSRTVGAFLNPIIWFTLFKEW